jgi:hypothetical protein
MDLHERFNRENDPDLAIICQMKLGAENFLGNRIQRPKDEGKGSVAPTRPSRNKHGLEAAFRQSHFPEDA